jgi:hypothetical protein
MQRPQPFDDAEDAIDQRLALEVANFAQGDTAAKVLVVVGVAAGTPERTLARDFNRKGGTVPAP